MKAKWLGAIPVFFLFADAGWAAPDKPGTASELISAVKDSTARVVGEFSAEITRSTQGFVTAVVTNNMYEVAAGKLALERARAPEVKDFARKMIEAHGEITDRLKTTIRSNNVNAQIPERMDARRRGLLDDLRGAQNFDHRYLVQQIAAHREADILMHRYAKVGKINAVRDFAAKTDRMVETHLAMARALAAKIP